MTILTTNRLSLHEAQLTDTEFIFKLLNSPNWITHIGDRGIRSSKDAEKYIRNALIHSYRENGFGLYKMMLKETQIPIGLCGLLKRPKLDHPDIGFAILPEYEGKGYTYEAAKATIKQAGDQLGLKTILAITSESNLKSQNLINKLGLEHIKNIQLEEDGQELLLFSN